MMTMTTTTTKRQKEVISSDISVNGLPNKC